MRDPFQVSDSPREVPAGLDAEAPPATLAWRALRAIYQAQADEHERQQRHARKLEALLIVVAEELHRLRQMSRSEKPITGEAVEGLARRLERALVEMDVDVVAPEGEVFDAALMELLENTAQRPEDGLAEPRVAEVLAPAVVYRGGILRMGKAVIAVPK